MMNSPKLLINLLYRALAQSSGIPGWNHLELKKIKAEIIRESGKIIDAAAEANIKKQQDIIKTAEIRKAELIKEKEAATKIGEVGAIAGVIAAAEKGIIAADDEIRAAKKAITENEERMLEAYLKTTDAEGKIAIASGRIAELEKQITDANKRIVAADKTIATANAVANLLDDTKLSPAEKEARDNAVGGQIYASTHAALLRDHGLRNVVQAHMPGLSAQPVLTASNGTVPVGTTLNTATTRTWASAWGFDGKTSGARQDGNLHHKGSGLAVGGDVRVSEHAALGLTLGYEDGKVANNDTLHAHTNVKAYTLGSYASVQAGAVTLQGGVLYSKLDLTTDRDLDKVLAGLGQAKASYKGSKVQAFAEVARAFELGAAATVTPYANLTQTWLHTDRAQERGTALLPVAVKAQNSRALQSTLGVRASYRLPTAAPVALTAHLGWAHAFGNAAKMSGNFAGSADNFALKAARTDKDHALVGVGVSPRARRWQSATTASSAHTTRTTQAACSSSCGSDRDCQRCLLRLAFLGVRQAWVQAGEDGAEGDAGAIVGERHGPAALLPRALPVF